MAGAVEYSLVRLCRGIAAIAALTEGIDSAWEGNDDC
jgi:hypothetical protein